jgi:hypothetical protein
MHLLGLLLRSGGRSADEQEDHCSADRGEASHVSLRVVEGGGVQRAVAGAHRRRAGLVDGRSETIE